MKPNLQPVESHWAYVQEEGSRIHTGILDMPKTRWKKRAMAESSKKDWPKTGRPSFTVASGWNWHADGSVWRCVVPQGANQLSSMGMLGTKWR